MLTTLRRQQHGVDATKREVVIDPVVRPRYVENPMVIRLRHGFLPLDLMQFVDRLGLRDIGFGRLLRLLCHRVLAASRHQGRPDLRDSCASFAASRSERGTRPIRSRDEARSPADLPVTAQAMAALGHYALRRRLLL
ncbi:MAG: hypothetical protein AAFX81_14280 [Pseudomonadota bacterium]